MLAGHTGRALDAAAVYLIESGKLKAESLGPGRGRRACWAWGRSVGFGGGRRALGVWRIARFRHPWLQRASAGHPWPACARPPGHDVLHEDWDRGFVRSKTSGQAKAGRSNAPSASPATTNHHHPCAGGCRSQSCGRQGRRSHGGIACADGTVGIMRASPVPTASRRPQGGLLQPPARGRRLSGLNEATHSTRRKTTSLPLLRCVRLLSVRRRTVFCSPRA